MPSHIALRSAGHDVQQQYALTVHDEHGTILREYFTDLFIDNRLTIEVKSIKAVRDDQIT